MKVFIKKFTATLLLCSNIFIVSAQKPGIKEQSNYSFSYGGIVRGDSTKKEIALVFTGDEFGDGLSTIVSTLQQQKVRGSFFFTGRFYRNALFQPYIKQLYKNGNYLGPHSDQHLLYCDWNKRDSLLVTQQLFKEDLQQNLKAIKALNINISKLHYFIPPYEWWNDSIAAWSKAEGLQIINFTPCIKTAADYTYPEMGTAYKSTALIIDSLKQFEVNSTNGLNGCIILIHAGTDERRKDKLYNRLSELIDYFKSKGYQLKCIDELLD